MNLTGREQLLPLFAAIHTERGAEDEESGEAGGEVAHHSDRVRAGASVACALRRRAPPARARVILCACGSGRAPGPRVRGARAGAGDQRQKNRADKCVRSARPARGQQGWSRTD